MEIPPPDAKKLLHSWMEWERGEVTPGRAMANLKTGGLPVLLNALLAEEADADAVPPAPAKANAVPPAPAKANAVPPAPAKANAVPPAPAKAKAGRGRAAPLDA